MVMLVQESIILKTTIRRKKIVSVTLATKLSKLSNGLWLGVCYFALQTFQQIKFIGKIIAQTAVSGWCGKIKLK
jgi:hypothetical protein